MLEDSFLCGFETTIPFAIDSRKITDKILDSIDGKKSRMEIVKMFNLNIGTEKREFYNLLKSNKIKKIGSKILNGKNTHIYDRTN